MLPARSRLAAAAVVAALSLVASACGGGDAESTASPEPSPSATLPTGDVDVPEGTELTPAGTELGFGDPATLAYQAGDRGSVVELTVLGVRTGRVADLAAYQLTDATRRSTPYYVRVRVGNVGTGGLGRAAVPLFAVDGANTLVQPSTFTTPFRRCPSTALPAKFAAGDTTTTCLVYLLPDRGTLEAMSYRPLQSFAPIVWTGDVAPAPQRSRQRGR